MRIGAKSSYLSRAQRSTISAFARVFARYGDALLNRDRSKLRIWNGPGSATQRFTLHRVRDTPLS